MSVPIRARCWVKRSVSISMLRLDLAIRIIVFGSWFVVRGSWAVGRGPWAVDRGPWAVGRKSGGEIAKQYKYAKPKEWAKPHNHHNDGTLNTLHNQTFR
jgi:hypothetical protein